MCEKNQADIKMLHKWIEECPKGGMVFFGGAGVSTESGIPDFRSVDGLYNQKYQYPPETIISHSFYEQQPKEFFDFYFDKMIAPEAKPNKAHLKLAELEERGILRGVVTQNIDGLHEMAGSKNVWDLHGSVHRNYCTRCHAFYDMQDMIDLRKQSEDGVPRCNCGAVVKPDVVLYEEQLNEQVISRAIEAIQEADLLVVGGTSLVVYPAAGFVNYFGGSHLAIVNLSRTALDRRANLCISGKIGEVFDF